jgi:hypothetical protein
MDKLMSFINSNPAIYGMNVFYSTPSIYVDAVHAANLTWTVKTEDFFPYAGLLKLPNGVNITRRASCVLDWVFYKQSSTEGIRENKE